MQDPNYDQANIFNKIIQGKVDVPFKKESDKFIIIKDINPAAWQHYLIIPKWNCVHLLSESFKSETLSEVYDLIREITSWHKEVTGYKVNVNGLPTGGQVVPHLHFHILLFND